MRKTLVAATVMLAASSVGGKPKGKTAAPAAPAAPAGHLINDAWYTMQAGNTPFGYFHEVIEKRADRYSYRYALTKVEKSGVYRENIGAIAEADLTPVTFNLHKSGTSTTETTDGTYARTPNGGAFTIEVSGSRVARFKRHVSKGAILDVFFPVWLSLRWDQVRPGYRGWVQTFAEDPDRRDFLPRTVRFQVVGRDTAADCTRIKVTMTNAEGDWCMTAQGSLVELTIGRYRVRRVKDEKAATDFLGGVLNRK